MGKPQIMPQIMTVPDGVQWLLLRGAKPALKQEDFGSSKELYKAVTTRFSLMDQFRGGAVQRQFSEFAKSVRPNHVEASRVNLSDLSPRDLYIVSAKGHKTEAVNKFVQIARETPELAHLLSAPDLSDVWRKAQTPEDSIVGGFDVQGQFMFFLARPPLEDAKSLFAIPENPGRYKPRPERDPAFISHGNKGVAIIQYPEQIEKAEQHLHYFLRAANGTKREACCLVMGGVVNGNDPTDDARLKLYQMSKFSGIEIVHIPDTSISAVKMKVGELVLQRG